MMASIYEGEESSEFWSVVHTDRCISSDEEKYTIDPSCWIEEANKRSVVHGDTCISSDEEKPSIDPSCWIEEANKRSIVDTCSSSDEEKPVIGPSCSTAKANNRIKMSSNEELQDIPSHSTALTNQRSGPGFIQPGPKRLKTSNVKFEYTLYRETWHAIKAPKALFKDNKYIASLLLSTATKVNTTVPVGCDSELAFLVDTSKLDCNEDLTCDETGKYKRASYARCKVAVDDEDNILGCQEGSGAEMFTLLRRYYPHRDTPGFFRTIYEIQREGVRICPVVLLRYEWRGEKTSLRLTPHGNCKSSNSPFIRSKKSLIQELKKPSNQSAQGRLNKKFQEQGRSVGIESFASVPRDRRQIYRHSAGGKKQTNFTKIIAKNATGDSVRSIESEKNATGDFVRSIEFTNDNFKGPPPRCVLYTNQQIKDMKRNCGAGSVISFDGTFDCGHSQMCVTTASYRHQEFLNKRNGKNVLMPGPILLHTRRDTETYQYFGNQISKAMENDQVPFFGTDGEKALCKGLKDSPSFSNSNHLLCMIHHRKNVESKLLKLGVLENTSKILRSIYGEQVNETRYEGLVDSENNKEFEEALLHWSTKWDYLEREETGKQPEFAGWFRQYKSQEVKECMLKPIRQQAGLGDHPRQFSTKDCENMNSMISKWIGGKKSWNDLVNSLKEFVKSKYTELEMSIIGLGERRPVNEDLQKTPSEWAHMKSEERRVILESANLSASERTSKTLSISPEECGIRGFTQYELQDVWTRAGRIIKCNGSIVDFPSCSSLCICFDDKDHFKVSCQNDFFACDKQCKSFILHDRLFCEHTLAVAEQKDKLAGFLCRINAKKRSSSVNLANTDLQKQARQEQPFCVACKVGVIKLCYGCTQRVWSENEYATT